MSSADPPRPPDDERRFLPAEPPPPPPAPVPPAPPRPLCAAWHRGDGGGAARPARPARPPLAPPTLQEGPVGWLEQKPGRVDFGMSIVLAAVYFVASFLACLAFLLI